MGFSTEGRLPVRRGYNHSLGFLGGGEDHYKQTAGACPGLGPTVDLWEDTSPVRRTSFPLDPLNPLPEPRRLLLRNHTRKHAPDADADRSCPT